MDDMEMQKHLNEVNEKYNDDIEVHYRDIAKKYDNANKPNVVHLDDDFDDDNDSDDYESGYVTQSDIVDEYYDDYDYDNCDDCFEETEIDDDYNDW